MTVAQATTTYAFIEETVRHLTACASDYALPSATIQRLVNLIYSTDFPNAIKTDQLRTIYRFVTIPNVDRYPVDANSYQGFRAPVYFEGIQGGFFKNRDQLFNIYPRFPTQYQKGVTLSGTITAILQPSNPTQITDVNHGLQTGSIITIENVEGMIELNGNTYTVTVIDADTFTLDGVDNTAFTPYTSGGTWTSTNTFSFTLFGNNLNPFPQNNFGILPTQLVIGGIDINGNPIRIIDDGGANVNSYGIGNNTTQGNLIFINNNNVGANVYLNSSNGQMPSVPPLSPLGGGNTYYNPSYPAYPPTPLTPQYCGTVNYITTQINILLPVPAQEGSMINIWAAQYQTGRPYNLLWWNNEFTIRPVPDNMYLVEVEAYMTPVQFMQTTDDPQIKQWALYLSYLTAQEILRQRQDMEGVQNLEEGRLRQEALVLEKQAVEEIGIANITMFNSTTYGLGGGLWGGIGSGY
jgi:hypothetical protein